MASLTREMELFLQNPPAGSACAAARDFGIDLTLVIEQLRLTPEERLRRLGELCDGVRRFLTSARRVHLK